MKPGKWIPLLAMALAGCGERGTTPPPQPRVLERYVALGNSITAGYESDGFNDSTQAHAYPAQLAARFGREFNYIRLQKPGCPAPLVGPVVLTQERVGGASRLSCAGIVSPVSLPLQNLAVPGIKIADVLSVPSGPAGAIYNQVLGNRTLLQVALDADPTLVSVWLGNNDALTAATSGDTDRLTPLSEFQASLNAIVTALAGEPRLRDAILMGVVDPQFAPLVQPGAFLWLARQDPATAALVPKPVDDNCAPFGPTGQLNARAANLVSLRVLADPNVARVSCADAAPWVLSGAEQQAISTRVAEFNQAIRAAAEARGWIYFDPNPLLRARLADPSQIRRCQGLAGASTLAQARTAALATCPSPSAPNFFGALISFDGVHPSRAGHALVADALAEALRAKHTDL